jgi:hypothetical protein
MDIICALLIPMDFNIWHTQFFEIMQFIIYCFSNEWQATNKTWTLKFYKCDSNLKLSTNVLNCLTNDSLTKTVNYELHYFKELCMPNIKVHRNEQCTNNVHLIFSNCNSNFLCLLLISITNCMYILFCWKVVYKKAVLDRLHDAFFIRKSSIRK